MVFVFIRSSIEDKEECHAYKNNISIFNELDSDQGERELNYGKLPSHQFTNHYLADAGVYFEIYER